MEIIVVIVGAIATLIAIIAGIVQILDYFEKKRKDATPQVKSNLKRLARPKTIVVSSSTQTPLKRDKDEQSFAGLNQLASTNLLQLMQVAGLQALAIDDCVMISGSKDFKGWSANEIDVTIQETEAVLPPDLQQVVETHQDTIAVHYGDTKSYRVVSFSPWLTDRPTTHITLAPLDFQTHFLISSLLDKPILKTPDGKLTNIRQEFGSSALHYTTSTHPAIPTNVSIQTLIISEDDKVLLGQRSEHVLYYPGAWSASLEETMQGPCKASNTDCVSDHDFVEGTLRAIHEELGFKLEISPSDIRVLSFCIEYPTLSFDVLCMAQIHTTADNIIASWLLTAPDKFEANRLEALPLQFDALVRTFYEDRLWHPTSRMRLLQLMIHKYGFDTTLSAIHV
jgi:hypothetical protein